MRAASPSSPDSSRGRPTTTSIASSSSVRATMASTSLSEATSRGRVRTGWASTPEASDAATPTRALPTSTPTRAPGRVRRSVKSRAPVSELVLDGAERHRDTGRIGASALGQVVLAAATAAERLGGRLDEGPGLEPGLPGALVRRDDHDRTAVRHGGHRHEHRPVVAETAPHVGDELAQVVAGDPVARVVADERHAGDVASRLDETGRSPEHLALAHGCDLLLGVAQPSEDGRDAVGELVPADPERVGQLADDRGLAGQVGVRVGTHERFDASHAGADRALTEQLDDTDLADARGVRADTQLTRPLADRDDPDPFAVLLAEERHGAELLRSVDVHDVRRDGQVVEQHGVDPRLDLTHRRGRGGLERLEVEAQAARGVLGPGLSRRVTELVAQGLVHHVGRRVGARDRPAAHDVHLGLGVLAQAGLALEHRRAVHDEAGDGSLDVGDLDEGTVREADVPVVGLLTTGLRVERRAVEHDLDLVAGTDPVDDDAVADQPPDARVGQCLVVAGELDVTPEGVGQLPVDARVTVRRLLRPRIGLGPVALLAHEPAEAGLVDLQPLLRGHLERQVDREAVGVVQRERLGSAEARRTGRLGPRHRRVEDRRARAQGAPEGVLLGVRDLADPVEVGLELRVGGLHPIHADRQQLLEGRRVDAEQAHRADRTAQQSAQDVAAALVAGRDAVTDEHERAAHVIGDDAEAHVVLVVGAVATAREVLRGGDDRKDLVGLVDVVDALQQERDALEPHAGVDVALGQLARDVEVLLRPDVLELVLHEHEVPELEVAVARLPVAVCAELAATIQEDLGAGTAGTGDAHVPVVVLAPEAHDAVVGKARDLLPERDRLVVLVVDGRVEVLLVEPEATLGLAAGDELPRQLDGAFLEVVAEAEVAVHLEERAMPGGLADLLDVEGPHALLHARGARELRGLLAEEVRLERDHAGVDEQQVRVLVHERGARHDGVAAAAEVREPTTPDLSGFHDESLGSTGVVCGSPSRVRARAGGAGSARRLTRARLTPGELASPAAGRRSGSAWVPCGPRSSSFGRRRTLAPRCFNPNGPRETRPTTFAGVCRRAGPPVREPAQRHTSCCVAPSALTPCSGGVLDLRDEVGLDLREVARLEGDATLAEGPGRLLGCRRDERRLLLGADVLRLPAPGAETAAARRVDRARHVADEADALLGGAGARDVDVGCRREQGL